MMFEDDFMIELPIDNNYENMGKLVELLVNDLPIETKKIAVSLLNKLIHIEANKANEVLRAQHDVQMSAKREKKKQESRQSLTVIKKKDD